MQAGDTLDLLITPDCEGPCYDKLSEALKVAGVRVHLYGRHFKNTPALVGWLERWPAAGLDPDDRAAAAARIVPRRFDPVVFDGYPLSPPLALLRRNGAVVGTL